MSMNKLALGCGLALLSMVGGDAVAGYKATNSVYVDTANRFASASIGGARNTANTTEYVDFIYIASSGSEFLWAFMRDASNVAGSCTTSSPTFLNAAKSINSDSYVYIAWDASGSCTHMEVRTTSYHPPKAP
jgi:hypothetical protein